MAKQQPPQTKRASRKKSDRLTRILVGGIVLSIVVIVLGLWNPLKWFKARSARQTAEQTKQRTGEKQQPGEKVGTVAIVIDDLGQDLKPARELASISKRITFSVMPGLPQSKKVAELARKNGNELFLHLPMEPRDTNGKRASVGTLRANMTPMEFMSTIADDIASVPGAVGVNNHEGSGLTENREAMKFLMAELKARELKFLDSLTSSKSIAYATAKEFGLKAAKRDVFLDNDGEHAAAIRKQLDELVRVAKKNGKAIGIGHPHPATIAELKTWIADAGDEGIEIVPVSKLMQ